MESKLTLSLRTKDKDSGKFGNIGSVWVNQRGVTVNLSKKNEDGKYIKPAKIVYEDGTEADASGFINGYLVGTDEGTIELVSEVLSEQLTRNVEFEANKDWD